MINKSSKTEQLPAVLPFRHYGRLSSQLPWAAVAGEGGRQERIKSSSQLNYLSFMFYFARVRHTQHAPSAKANCSFIMFLWVDRRGGCTSSSCALCQNVDAPLPRWIWQLPGRREAMVKLYVTRSSLTEGEISILEVLELKSSQIKAWCVLKSCALAQGGVVGMLR